MKILMVLSSHDGLGGTDHNTDFWLENFSAPYYALKDAGAMVTFVSPQGGQPPMDLKSDEAGAQTASNHRFKGDLALEAELANTFKLRDFLTMDFDAVFYPGELGSLWDLAEDTSSIALIESMLTAGKPVVAVCHAPGVLRHAMTSKGVPIVKDKEVTGFSKTEEEAAGLSLRVPFHLEDELQRLGATYSKGADWQAHVVVDDLLITGQNPASSLPAARALLGLLKQTSMQNTMEVGLSEKGTLSTPLQDYKSQTESKSITTLEIQLARSFETLSIGENRHIV